MSRIDIDRITKRFGGTVALDSVSLSIAEGECHALVGENGAGKSTLGKILAGIYAPDEGAVVLDGQRMKFRSVRDARAHGIGMVHQELALCPDLTVAENLLLGHMPAHAGTFVDNRRLRTTAQALLAGIAPELDARRMVRSLSIAERQLVQIATAIGTGARTLVFDEPTSSLSESESSRLFSLIHELRTRHVTIIYVSHRLPEVFRLADRISVLRDGRFIGTLLREEATEERLVRMMIGRELVSDAAAAPADAPGAIMLDVRELSSAGSFERITLTIRAGEILGVAGLVGAGRSEMANAIFGLDNNRCTGTVALAGDDVSARPARARMNAGLAYVPADRKLQGLALELSCRRNFSLTLAEQIRRFCLIDHAAERKLLERYFRMLEVKTPSPDSPVSSLSGGNQQKILFAKWLARDPRVFLMDEPTRGIDVGVKSSIHAIIRQLAARGTAILLISSELSELLALSHRVLVMRNGRICGETDRAHATEESLLRMMSGL